MVEGLKYCRSVETGSIYLDQQYLTFRKKTATRSLFLNSILASLGFTLLEACLRPSSKPVFSTIATAIKFIFFVSL